MERDAAPAREVRSLAPGRLRDPTGGHYDPSARSSLDWDHSILLSDRPRRDKAMSRTGAKA
jgi:hypothetical protein